MDERKTPDDRQKMTELERIRHSCAHVLATAILRLWPDAQFAAGPPVENGFYYDVELSHRISPEDFPKIEEEMKKEIKANHPFEKIVVAREQAVKDAQSGRLGALGARSVPSRYKLGNLEDIPEGEQITYYQNGDFIDLCAGPHLAKEKMYLTSGHLPYYEESMFPPMRLQAEGKLNVTIQGYESQMDALKQEMAEELKKSLPDEVPPIHSQKDFVEFVGNFFRSFPREKQMAFDALSKVILFNEVGM